MCPRGQSMTILTLFTLKSILKYLIRKGHSFVTFLASYLLSFPANFCPNGFIFIGEVTHIQHSGRHTKLAQ
jgi:hypothetical protein